MVNSVNEEQLDILGESSYTESLLTHLDKVPIDEIRSHWPQDAAALLDIFIARLESFGINTDNATKQAVKLLADAAEYGGGRNWYLPTKESLLQHLRDRQIYIESRSLPVRDLVKKYRLAESHIYRIIKTQQSLYIKRRQPNLF